MIYFDCAATSLYRPPCVAQAICVSMTTWGNPARGSHEPALAALRGVTECREELARLFGLSDPSRVVFTSNGTEALNTVLNGVLEAGDHVITTAMEHNSVLRPLYRLEREQWVQTTILPVDRQGLISYEELEHAVCENTRAVVCTHASNVTGNLLELARIGRLCKKHGLLFVVDAAQTAGLFPIHMEEMGISVLCFTGHKSLLGPQGVGGLCIAPGVDIRPLKTGGSGVDSFRRSMPEHLPAALEAGTLNSHGIAGLHAGVRWLCQQGQDALREREQALARRFYDGVREVSGVTVYGDFSTWDRAAIVSLNLSGQDSAVVADALAQRFDIAVRAGAHCAPLLHKALGTAKQGVVRFSFSHFNEEDEVDRAIQAVRTLAAE